MVRTVKKKVNPHGIPIPRNAINRDTIIEEAMKDDMAHAWLLVAGPLLDRGYDLPPLANAVSAYVNKNTDKPTNRAVLTRVEKALGYSRPNLDTRHVKSPVELEAFKRKVWRVAMETALCVVYLGLESRISEDELKDIFFSADLTLAEIERGLTDFDTLQREILTRAGEMGKVSDL